MSASPRALLRLVLCASAAIVLVVVLAAGDGKRPLDLPAAHAQAGPGSVLYYGELYSGDTFVWCFDKSGSMDGGGQFQPMKDAIIAALGSLSPNQSFSLVTFSTGYVVYAWTPVAATPANVASATAFISAVTADGTTCALAALLAALDIVAGASSPTIFFVSDGGPNCPGPQETLDAVNAANPLPIPIHTFAIPPSAFPEFLQDLADQNGGTFTDVEFVGQFRRGDANGDGAVSIVDAIALLEVAFAGSTQVICEDAADANDDGALQGIPDAIALLSHLFVAGSPAPPLPYPGCGVEPTPDPLACLAASCP